MMQKVKNRTICKFSVGSKFKIKEQSPWDASNNSAIKIMEIVPCTGIMGKCESCIEKSRIRYIYTGGRVESESFEREMCSFQQNAHKLERIE